MKIKLTDILTLMDHCNSYPELKIKCDLMYGSDFDIILDRLLDKMGYMIDQETLIHMTIRDLISYIGMIARNFEMQNRIYINKSVDYNAEYYNRIIDVYYIPECFKYENISIDI